MKRILKTKWYVVDVSSFQQKDVVVKGPFNTASDAAVEKEPDDGPCISQIILRGNTCLHEGIDWWFNQKGLVPRSGLTVAS
jgi:hypothetical protein